MKDEKISIITCSVAALLVASETYRDGGHSRAKKAGRAGDERRNRRDWAWPGFSEHRRSCAHTSAEIEREKTGPFKLGFAQGAVSWMVTAQQFALSLPRAELEQAGVGWTIFSSEALVLQTKMHLTDAQLVELFGARAARDLKRPAGPL